MKLLVAARRHAGLTLIAGVAVLGTAGVATAVAVTPTSAESEVYEAPVETTAPTTSSAPEAPVVAPAPVPEVAPVAVEPPVADTPPASVEPVTEPAPQAPADEPEIADPESIGSFGEDGNYTPAPPRLNPGEPPVAPLPEPPPLDVPLG